MHKGLINHQKCIREAGARERFFLGGGGKNVDMPSDCQNLGGAQAYPSP